MPQCHRRKGNLRARTNWIQHWSLPTIIVMSITVTRLRDKLSNNNEKYFVSLLVIFYLHFQRAGVRRVGALGRCSLQQFLCIDNRQRVRRIAGRSPLSGRDVSLFWHVVYGYDEAADTSNKPIALWVPPEFWLLRREEPPTRGALAPVPQKYHWWLHLTFSFEMHLSASISGDYWIRIALCTVSGACCYWIG